MNDRGCDVAIVPPTDNEGVVVRGRVVTGGWFGGDVGGRGSIRGLFGGDARLMTLGFCPECVGRWTGWLVVGPGIAKSQPGKSGRGQGGGVLPANFCNVRGELVALHFWDSVCSNVACFVVAVAKALSLNPPAGAHEGARIIPRPFP